MMTYKKWLILALCALLGPVGYGQSFQEMMEHPTDHDFNEITTAAKAYFDKNGRGKGSGFKQYMRWQWFMESRLDEQGRLQNPRVRNFEETQKFREFNLVNNRVQSPNGNWIAKGPTNYTTTIEGTGPGLGRLNTLAFDPNNSSILYVGAADGGLWKSFNSGASWTPLSDGLANLGVSGIAIDPKSTNTIYILTGDGPGAFSTLWPSIHNVGVLKSINGGSSWQSTGLTFTAPNASRGHRLIIDPTSPNNLLVATSSGIYRTTNSGATWPMTQAGNFKSMEYKPNDPSTVYAATETDFYRSLDGGLNWSLISSAVLPTDGERGLLAVSPNQPNWVYLTFANDDHEFIGLYRSTNSGTSWTQVNNGSVDLFSQAPQGNQGQSIGKYAMAMAINPNNANIVEIAALNHWRSTNGGTSFTLQATWATDSAANNGVDYCHGDYHFLQYRSGSELWACNDGGAWRRINTGTWQDRSIGLGITQIYRLGENSTTSTPVYLGTQDQGLFKYTGTNTHTHAWIGDVMDVAVNQDNPNIIYAERFFGQLYRSTDAGVTFQTTPMVNGTFEWITPVEVDPDDGDRLYTIDRNNRVFRSIDAGVSFQLRNSTARPSVDIEVAPSNSNVLHACDETRVWKSFNQGGGWTLIGSATNLPLGGAPISDIEIDDANHNTAWITAQGYVAGQKVYVTTDAGGTWTNISAGLPNVPINAVVHDHGSANGIYVGTDIGVWYRDDNNPNWVDFNTGLPSVVVLDLEIHETAGVLRAGTYGRGYWESDLFSSGPPACPDNLTLTGTVSSDETFEARDFITSSQRITGSQTDVVYDAGDYIELTTGFEAVAGIRSFTTRLVGCNSLRAAPISGIYEGPMPGVVIPYELPPEEDAAMDLRMAPNPGNDLVSFIFNLPKDGTPSISMYSIQGEKVAEVLTGTAYSAGEYRIRYDVSELPNGVYFVKMQHGEEQQTERLVVLH